MAANIFTNTDAQQILHRLSKLGENSIRQWGSLSPAEMCWHCRQQLEFLAKPTPPKVLNTMYRFQPMKWLIIFAIPWPREAPTAPSMDAKKSNPAVESLEAEKSKLIAALETVLKMEKVKATHPLFGELGKHYWGRLIWKHLHHHLRQFSC
jgi:Protein of unknown function (DUF1569)